MRSTRTAMDRYAAHLEEVAAALKAIGDPALGERIRSTAVRTSNT